MLGQMSRKFYRRRHADDSTLFNPLHPPGTLENNLSPDSYKGRVDPEITAIAAAKQNAERARIASARAALAPVETILGIDEFEVCHLPISG